MPPSQQKIQSEIGAMARTWSHCQIATYSPELNLIEIVWRFIKYQWLPLSAYSSFENLKLELQNVLDAIGSEYQITFASIANTKLTK